MNWLRNRMVPAGFAALCAGIAGCDDGGVSFNYNRYERRPVVEHRVVYVQPTHVCTSACHDHVYDGGHVIVVSGHQHGPNCGHPAVPHGDHVDYLVDGHLHHPHGDHCDDHGPVKRA